MRHNLASTNIAEFDAISLSVASPEDILEWSHGEVTKPETINYRTQKPERDGLFCERIFGPIKDINPNDVKFKGVRSREAAVDKNGEVVTKSIVRRERMGHITLASPVAHIWFLRGTPSAIGLVLGMTVKNLERVAYFASYIIKSVDVKNLEVIIADKEAEYNAAKEAIRLRYEKQSAVENVDLKSLAEQQTKELEELTANYELVRDQLQSINKYGLISETDYRNLAEDIQSLIRVGMGGSALKDLLDEINLNDLIKILEKEADEAKGQRKKKVMKRLRLIENMHRAGIKPSDLCVSVIPVIPPDLRPMVQLTGGRFATSDLNDLYRRVINRNNRLKKLIDLNAPEVIRRNEQRMLQEAVDALIDNNNARSGRAVAATGQRRRLKSLSDTLKGKQGRFRQNLLGKRVDYSGRSVIVAGPELKINQCGMPKMMALELFKPFVIGKLIENEKAHNIRSATRMIEMGEIEVWDTLDEVIKGKYVLLNRAPSLHRMSIQAFQPVLIEGKAVQLHPLVCRGFNADFDGDQMAVHLPLSEKAQEESRDIMAANKNLLKPADGSPILHIEQDIVLGCYYLTYKPPKSVNKVVSFSNLAEAIMAYDNQIIKLQDDIRIMFRGVTRKTTLGRVLFNEVLPEDFDFQDEAMTKKKLQQVMASIYEKYGQAKTAEIADDLMALGFQYATSSGLSMGMGDFADVKGLESIIQKGEKTATEISQQYEQGFITDNERYRLTIECWKNTVANVQEVLSEQFTHDDSSMAIAVTSGARGNISQVMTAVGMFGISTDTSGRDIELPIKSNYKKGLTPLEYFTATRGARKVMINTALKTADAGYLTRRLVDVSQDVFTIDEEMPDNGFSIYRQDSEEIGINYGARLKGRFSAEKIGKYIKKRGQLITPEIATLIEDDKSINDVKIMSVLSCSSVSGISRKSYGLDPATGELVAPHHPIGVIAAQSIGEPGTQLTLKSFHSGGVSGEDITTGLPRVEELFEARSPKGQAYLSEIAGVVHVREDGDHYVMQIVAKDSKLIELPLKGRKPQVANGSTVAIGDVIASGKNNTKPLVATMAGKVDFVKNMVILLPSNEQIQSYNIPGYKQLLVKEGEEVEAGHRLTNGSINLHELMELKGVEATQRYIMNEILRIFASQGQNIADKHLEIIIRQMFSRVQIEEPGDSELVIGDICSKLVVAKTNKNLTKAGKKPAKYEQLLLGITKASLSTDSFLSAASFQDTTRVLISAATSGRVDHLFGLKENVILGRRIPVGTGYQTDEAIEEIATEAVK